MKYEKCFQQRVTGISHFIPFFSSTMLFALLFVFHVNRSSAVTYTNPIFEAGQDMKEAYKDGYFYVKSAHSGKINVTLSDLTLFVEQWLGKQGTAWIDENQGWLDNGVMKLGIDITYGGAIVYVSVSESLTNLVNIYDHGRQIQQSYYAGDVLDRTHEGQSEHWTPWPWNPVQAGNWIGDPGVVLSFSAIHGATKLYTETQPRLWDLDGELANATMKQWAYFEPGMDNVVRIDNQIEVWREPNDIWGGPVPRHQECPAAYLIRDLNKVVLYDGDIPWQNKPLTVIAEHTGDQPPWDIYHPTEHWMACVYPHNDFGVGIYSRHHSEGWNVGAVGSGGGCSKSPSTMHLAAIQMKTLAHDSVWSYTYWIILGDINAVRSRAYELAKRY